MQELKNSPLSPFGVAITGGIGCGKSEVERILKQSGWTVVDTDEIAHRLMMPHQQNWKNIVDVFGKEILNRDQTINRTVLGELVFGNPELREKLNQITHPSIEEAWRNEERLFRETHPQQKTFAVAIPLLFEKGWEVAFTKVIAVGCSQTTQEARLKERGWSATQIQNRVQSQFPLTEKMKKSDLVIWNEGSLELLKRQVHYFLSLQDFNKIK